MRSQILLATALALTLPPATPARAGRPFGHKHRAAACRAQAQATYQSPACGGGYVVAVQPMAMVPVLPLPPIVGTIPPPAGVQPDPGQRSQFTPPSPAYQGGAPGAFLAWLNGFRASHGLSPVGWDAAIEADCQVNNQHQAARGLGHHWLGCHRRQNSATGAGFPGVEVMWASSPGHCSALLDPSITRVGIAWYGAFCTFGAN